MSSGLSWPADVRTGVVAAAGADALLGVARRTRDCKTRTAIALVDDAGCLMAKAERGCVTVSPALLAHLKGVRDWPRSPACR